MEPPTQPPIQPPAPPMAPLPPGSPPGSPPDHQLQPGSVRYDLVVITTAAIASSLTLVVLYRMIPRVRRTPGWLMVRAALCEMVVSGCLLALWFFEPNPEEGDLLLNGPTNTIAPLLLCVSAFEIAAHAWRFLMFLDIVATYRNPFEPDRYRPIYPLFVVVVSLAATAGIGVITGVIRNFDLCAPDQRPGPTPRRPPHTRRHHAHPHWTSAGPFLAPVPRVSHRPTTSFAPRAFAGRTMSKLSMRG
jgi:hypothetical protein